MGNAPLFQALAIAVTCLTWHAAAGTTPNSAAVLDEGWNATQRRMGGGQGLVEFWDGFGPGTSLVFRSEWSSDDTTYESETSYRIVRREEDQVILAVKDEETQRETTLAPRVPVSVPGQNIGKPEDRRLEGKQLITVGSEEYSCDVFERTVRSSPVCGTREPNYRLMRMRVWRCPEVSVQHGVLKVSVSWAEDWGNGPKQVQMEELVVTDLHTEKLINGVICDSYAVSIVGRRGQIVYREATQWRMDLVPGGVLEAVERVRNVEGTRPWHVSRHWVESLTIQPMEP